MYGKFYQAPSRELWQGRVDDPNDPLSYRWHQIIQVLDLTRPIKGLSGKAFAFLGFKSDEGVRRNLGRQGARLGPDSIRRQMANLPSYFGRDTHLFDAGDVECDQDLESAQQALAQAVEKILSAGIFPVLLGGGHEIALGHYLGLYSYYKKAGKRPPVIINLDAHFDMRPYFNGGSSGTMFLQIADFLKEQGEDFHYMVIGIQQSGNTRSLFQRADDLGVKYILARDISESNLEEVFEQIDGFVGDRDVYLTICADVFSSAVAPGVSAPQPFGMYPELVLKIAKYIARSQRLISFDIAEVSPRFDEDHQTAKLASVMIFAILNSLVNPELNLVVG